MTISVTELGLGLQNDWVTPTSVVFRPMTWPPHPEWPVSIDRNGAVISRWSDPLWDLTPLAGTPFKLNFGDGPDGLAGRLDSANADILRLMVTWRIWGPRPTRTAAALQKIFTMFRAVISLCSRKGILATDLMRFPRVFEQLPETIAPSRYDSTILELYRIYDSRDQLGFIILDQDGLKRLAGSKPDHDSVQTPYIPPRIWLYQVNRLRECLEDFIRNQAQIEACFRFCLEAYVKNYGTLEAALAEDRNKKKGPFTKNSVTYPDCNYYGSFEDTAARYNLTPSLAKWLSGRSEGLNSLQAFSAYLDLVIIAALAYIANFTLQRRDEVGSLRVSCLIWEEDEKLGRVPIICGETTKTDPDSDARWVASPSVELAVTALSSIALLRMQCDRANSNVEPTELDIGDPYLYSAPSEPWGGGKTRKYYIRRRVRSLGSIVAAYPCLFDPVQMTITPDDLKVAKQLTPNLPEDRFAVGQIWPLAWHQYRRTSAVNMFASGLISDSTMQHQLKHSSRLMPLYYGRGYTRLHLNENVSSTVVAAMYEAMATQLRTAMSDRFVSPYSDEHKQILLVNIISEKDAKKLTSWAKEGKVSYREHRLGGCMKAGACDYGGVESVARCAGSDNGKPCSDVLYDRTKEPQIRSELACVAKEMARLPVDSPRHRALLLEHRAMEVYLNAI